MKIDNKIFPGSNKIPLDGGKIHLFSSFGVDDTNDSYFDTLGQNNIFELGATPDGNHISDNLFEFPTDATDEQIHWNTFGTNGKSFDITNPFVIRQSIVANHDTQTDNPDMFSFGMIVGLSDFLVCKINTSFSGSDVIYEAEVEETIGGTTNAYGTQNIGQNLDGTEIEFAIVFTGSKDYKAFVRAGDGDWIELYSGTWSVSQDAAYAITVHSMESAGTVRIGRFYFDNYLDISDNAGIGVPFVSNKNSTQVVFDIRPGYPGNIDATYYGLGNNSGQSESVSFEIVSEKVGESSTKFFESPVKKLYENAEKNIVCNAYARKVDTLGDGEVKQFCFDDGTVQNLDTINPVIENSGSYASGHLNVRRAKDMPTFLLKEDVGDQYNTKNIYGENFSFERILQGEWFTSGFNNDESLRILKTLVLDNGDRFYYGVVAEDEISKDIDFTFNPLSNGFDSGWRIEDAWGQVIVEETPSGSPASPSIQNLEPGLYAYTVQNANGGVYLGDSTNGNRLNEIDDIEGYYNASLQPPDFADGDRDHKMFFEVKPVRGKLVCWYHDISENTIEKELDPNRYVSLRSDSISAVENQNGEPVVIFEKSTTDDLYGETKNYLAYRRFYDQGAGRALASSNLINFNNYDNSYIQAFDVVRVNDKIRFFISLGHGFGTGDYSSPSYAESWSPMLAEGIASISLFLDQNVISQPSINFDGSNITISNVLEGSSLRSKSLEDMYEHGDHYDPLFDEVYLNTNMNHFVEGNYFNYLDANYDSEVDDVILSALTYRTRAPVVFNGKLDIFNVSNNKSELCIPFHFDYMSGGLDNIGHLTQLYSGITSLSCCYGSDGMVYSVATKRNYVDSSANNSHYDDVSWVESGGQVDSNFVKRHTEIAVIDALSESEIKQFLEVEEPSNLRDPDGRLVPHINPNVDFKFETFPFFNIYGYDFFTNISLAKDNGYLIATAGSPRDGDSSEILPIIFQNGHQSTLPMEVPFEELWLPMVRDGSDFNFEYTDNYTILPDGYYDGSNYQKPRFYHTITETGKNKNAKDGYRFKSQIRGVLGGDNSTDYLRHNVVFEANAVLESGMSANNPPPIFKHYLARARVLFNGKEFSCQLRRNNSWVEVGVICDLDIDSIKDVEILIKYTDGTSAYGNNYEAIYTVSENTHVKQISQNSEAHSNYTEVVKTIQGNGKVDKVDTEEQTNFELRFDNDVNETSDYLELYEMGWAPLKAAAGFITEQVTFKTGASINSYYYEMEGDRWRRFNDGRWFNTDLEDVIYPFRTGLTQRGGSRTFQYHWPNGFKFYLTGTEAISGDEWSVRRSQIGTEVDLQRDNIHPVFRTKDDDGSVEIWADAHDSGLEKFNVDTFVVTGVNVPEIEVVGKNDITSPWNVLGKIDTTLMFADENKLEFKLNNNRDRIKIIGSDFYQGLLDEFTHYANLGPYDNANQTSSKIEEVSGDKIWVDSNTTLNTSGQDLTIFGSRGVALLSNQKYRYIGIRIQPYNTYENYFKLHHFDFGRRIEIPVRNEYDIGTGPQYESQIAIDYVFDEQPYSFINNPLKKFFDFEYTLFEDEILSAMKTMVRKIGIKRNILWVIENYKQDKQKIYPCLIEEAVPHSNIIDENGDKYHEFSLSLRSID